MQEILRNIANSYKNFSTGQKKVADLFIEQPIFLAFSSALEVGRNVNVSESTVIRWAQKLGYKGYAEFQQIVQQKLAQERLEQLTTDVSPQTEGQSLLKNLLNSDISNLQQLKQSLDEEQLLQAVDLISQAEQIYVTGNTFDYGMAYSFTTWLNHTLDHTEMLIYGDGQYYLQLSKLGIASTVIAFAFPRYEKVVTETLNTAKEQGASVIVITDSVSAPAVKYADIVLEVPMNSDLGIDSYTAASALLTSIMRFLSVKEHDKVKLNYDRTEAMYLRKNVYH
ncbi:MurR/RpiR family transcriptional regulator [Planococcus lenghuensis]|uniref:RpiR family transcriptional regulator n=1 Tax=Planococcus lenghuensis TaxID=2213202 RepID=A0A1Q2L242_9BACL|nr:MurR/RpiR family transcriptional regulator [Planococcus lenghuensis]AQQ54483.1 RpiR family transcriptional regulator [Planococcus lenghuensis]